jgi:hypothetical protein
MTPEKFILSKIVKFLWFLMNNMGGGGGGRHSYHTYTNKHILSYGALALQLPKRRLKIMPGYIL